LLGMLYAAVGTALVLASRNVWLAWYRAGADA
jgi:hypothetical protein